jgi:membrane-bound serine protease (ClpP class)
MALPRRGPQKNGARFQSHPVIRLCISAIARRGASVTLYTRIMKTGFCMLGMALTLAATAVPPAAAREAGLIDIDGPIGPATASYITRAIKLSSARDDVCLIIQLNTPGGLMNSMEDIVDAFYASPVPIVVYVAPEGARAGSAGTFITMAANVAAMAPHTTIGAAHPVQMGFGGGDAETVSTNDVMSRKLENYGTTYIRGIAEKRHRNVQWAESAVRESAAITAEKALELNVIDLIAPSVSALLEKIDGRDVNGRPLSTAGVEVVPIPMSAGEKLFQILWRPEVMMVLMLIAIYGIIAEINNPGAILPGVAGAIALVLFLYMSTVLPVNLAGIALIVLALILFLVDLYAPTHGVLTIGAIVSFFLGALMLFNRAGPGFQLSLFYIVPATVATALFFLFVAGAGLRAQRLPISAGRETLIGKVIEAVEDIDAARGKVFVEGEYWNAISATPIARNERVEITGIDGLTLTVKPAPAPVSSPEKTKPDAPL